MGHRNPIAVRNHSTTDNKWPVVAQLELPGKYWRCLFRPLPLPSHRFQTPANQTVSVQTAHHVPLPVPECSMRVRAQFRRILPSGVLTSKTLSAQYGPATEKWFKWRFGKVLACGCIERKRYLGEQFLEQAPYSFIGVPKLCVIVWITRSTGQLQHGIWQLNVSNGRFRRGSLASPSRRLAKTTARSCRRTARSVVPLASACNFILSFQILPNVPQDRLLYDLAL